MGERDFGFVICDFILGDGCVSGVGGPRVEPGAKQYLDCFTRLRGHKLYCAARNDILFDGVEKSVNSSKDFP